MNVLDRKLLRELAASRWLLLTIALIVTVGVSLFVYMRSTYFNLKMAQAGYYAQGRMADFWIDLKKAPLSEVAALEELPGVMEIRPRIQFYATVDLDRVKKPLNGLILSLPDVREPVINDIELMRGSYFSDTRREEVIVNDAFARKHGIRPGQWIHLILNNRKERLFVVGTAISCEFVYLVGPGAFVPDPEHFGVFYLKRTYAEDVFDFAGAANQVVGRLAPEVRERPDELLDSAERLLAPFGVFSKTARKNQPSNRYLSDEIRGLGVFANIMPVIFLAVAATVLNVLMMRLVDQQRGIIGTLKAIGYSDAAVFWHFTKFGLAVGLVGGLLGCPAGYGLSYAVTDLYKEFFEFPELPARVYPGTYAIGVAISLLCALVGSVRGARAAVRLRPAEAMRPRAPGQGGAVLLEKIGWLWRQLSFGWRMVLRLVFRNRVRTAVGVFAAMMGASLLMSGLMMVEAMPYMVDFQYEKVTRSDIDLGLADEHGREALAEARRLPAVDYAEPVLHVACTFTNGIHERKGLITGLSRDARLTVPRDLAGGPVEVPEVGLVMSRKMAELLDLSVGQEVSIRPIKGLKQTRRVPVVRITDTFLGLSTYADIEYLSRVVGEEYALNSVQLQVEPDETKQAKLYAELKELPAVQAVNARRDTIDNLNKTFVEFQGIAIGMLVGFAGVIFFGSILNASLVNLAERRCEVATFRVLGYTEWQIGGLFLRESMVVNLFGALLGLPLGYFLTVLMAWAYDTELFRFPVVVTPGTWLWTMVSAVAFGLLAHAVVHNSIRKMNWLDALNVKE